jgi:hypothetical protein
MYVLWCVHARQDMARILLGIVVALSGMSCFLKVEGPGTWLPSVIHQSKLDFERWALTYSVIWIAMFGVIVVTGVYEQFDEVRLQMHLPMLWSDARIAVELHIRNSGNFVTIPSSTLARPRERCCIAASPAIRV